MILTQTDIANTKKLRPRLESMAAEGEAIELDVHEWSRILLALCGARAKEMSVRKYQLRTAMRIASQLARRWGLPHPHCNLAEVISRRSLSPDLTILAPTICRRSVGNFSSFLSMSFSMLPLTNAICSSSAPGLNR